MSIKDMIVDIEHDAREEIEASKNRAKAESTKALMDKAEELEALYEAKKTKLETQLQRKEQTLKAEKDFAYRSMALSAEDKFAQTLIPFIKEGLLSFPKNSFSEYKQIIASWLQQAVESLGEKDLNLRINPRDKEIASLYKGITLISDASIEAGFIISDNKGVSVDLSFTTFFAEKQSLLQSLVMNALKEATQ